MDQIFDRFGNLLKSFFSDESSTGVDDTAYSDPDLQDAWDELEDFLRTDDGATSKSASSSRPPKPAIPAELRKDYALLKSKPDAPLEEVAKSYKQLLRIHHPDRHAGDPAAFSKATETTKELTSAFRRIKEYKATGK